MPNRKGCCKGAGLERQARWLAPSLLYLLWKESSHGYNLMADLPSLGFITGSTDPAAVYRTLNLLEQEGLVRSEWDTSGSGAAKRSYEITDQGKQQLCSWREFMQIRRDALDQFLRRLEELPDFDTFLPKEDV
ncbi:helix-turn-helix transcriptional regulator [candidate division KSB1 bacterium]|nr:helix-turn-helix transcriptional regulator [candidate division KSB1 bacterium]